MKALAVLIALLAAIVGGLWLIGFALQDQIHLLTHYPQHGSIVYTTLVGLMLALLGLVGACLVFMIFLVGAIACWTIDDKLISPYENRRLQRKAAAARQKAARA